MKKDDKELITLLKEECVEASGYYDSELAQQQADAMAAYYSRPYGDEVDGRSQTVTSDVADKINWIMPTLNRIFARSGDLITIDPSNKNDDAILEEAEEYLEHVIFNDNDFPEFLNSFAKDGLMYKCGIAKTYWKADKDEEAPQDYVNMSPSDFIDYYDDDSYEISNLRINSNGAYIDGSDISEDQLLSLLDSDIDVFFDATIKKVSNEGRVVIESIEPERFKISKLAKSIKEADYLSCDDTVYRSEMIKEYPKLKSELEQIGDDTPSDALNNDIRTQVRFLNENLSDSENYDFGRLTLYEEYIRFDDDEDGYVELLYVKRIGDLILEKFAVDESMFSAWTPIPIPHKFYGQSLAEITMPIQRVNTVLLRSALDNVVSSSRPRLAVNLETLSEQGFAQLSDQDIGAPILFDGAVDIQPIVIPDISANVLNQMEYMGRVLDARTGVKSDAMGVDTTSVHNTASGQEMLVNASDVRKEDIAAQLGRGLQDIAQKAFNLLCRNQDYKRTLKVNGKWIDFNPYNWTDKMAVTINVGTGAGNKQSHASSLMQIYQIQGQALTTMGEDNPIASTAEITNTLHELVKVMGYSDPTRFFKDLPSDEEKAIKAEQQGQQDPRTPEQIEAESKAQIAQQESQSKIDYDMAKLESEQGIKVAGAQADAARKDQIAAADIERADVELSANLSLKAQQLNGELSLKKGQIVEEIKLDAVVKTAEHSLKEKDHEHKTNLSNVNLGGDASK